MLEKLKKGELDKILIKLPIIEINKLKYLGNNWKNYINRFFAQRFKKI